MIAKHTFYSAIQSFYKTIQFKNITLAVLLITTRKVSKRSLDSNVVTLLILKCSNFASNPKLFHFAVICKTAKTDLMYTLLLILFLHI